MEQILSTALAQGGAIGLLVISGWVMFWLERKEKIRLQLKVEELLQSLTLFMNEQTKTIEDLTDRIKNS